MAPCPNVNLLRATLSTYCFLALLLSGFREQSAIGDVLAGFVIREEWTAVLDCLFLRDWCFLPEVTIVLCVLSRFLLPTIEIAQ